jgi:LacI family transcriptional regulator
MEKHRVKTIRGRKSTLLDVAKRAQLDPSVVSRVLNYDPAIKVRDATRERVFKAARDLHYRPNQVARALRTARAGAYGLLIPDFANPIYALVIKGAQSAAAAQGCVLLTGSADGDVREYLDLLSDDRVDGLLLSDARAKESLTRSLDSLGVPWILLNQRIPSVERYVVLDDEAAAMLAMRHLIDLGHRHIAHLAGPVDADTAGRRMAGYQRALNEIGLQADPRWVVETDYTYSGGAAALRQLFKSRRRPTAVFVANVASAIGALRAARELGWLVPQQLSLVTIHDLPLAEYLSPPLTTVQMPLEELGRRGVELLSSLPGEALIREVIKEPMQLVVRGSTTRPEADRHE